MNLAELIYKRFSEAEGLSGHLAKYQGHPAIFSPEAPDDTQTGWDGRTQYPRIIYNFDLQANTDRKSAGTLEVSLLCQNTVDVIPEEIEPEIRNCLRDVLIRPDGNSLFAFTWARTDAFSLPEKNRDLIIGSEIRFDILEYTDQETTDPDPVMAANQYIKALFPECTVIGLDRMDEITEASKAVPVIYCRLTAIEKARETNTVAWMDGKLAIHILCPDNEKRMKLTTALVNRLSLDGEIIMLDKSPMFIKRMQADYKSDYLKEGQAFLTVEYGLLRYMQNSTWKILNFDLKEVNRYGSRK